MVSDTVAELSNDRLRERSVHGRRSRAHLRPDVGIHHSIGAGTPLTPSRPLTGRILDVLRVAFNTVNDREDHVDSSRRFRPTAWMRCAWVTIWWRRSERRAAWEDGEVSIPRIREAARAIVLDEHDRVLLLR